MLVDSTLFFLLLAAITLVIVVLFAVVAGLFIEAKQKNQPKPEKNEETVRGAPQECAHFLGYLSKHPRDQPIPNDCFGCLLAIDCIKAQAQIVEKLSALPRK